MLWPLILPTEVWVSRPVPPVMPLRSSTNQAKKVKATMTINGLAALRKACIIGTVGTPDAGYMKSNKSKPASAEPQGGPLVSS